jgi:hypothetical protein
MLNTNTKEKIVLYQIALAVLLIFNTLFLCSTNGKIAKLAKQQIIGVQLEDGSAISAEKKDASFRSDETIKEFSKKWYNLALNWKTDDVPIETKEVKVPGNLYAATLAITSNKNFDKEFSKEMEALIQQISSDKISSAVSISYVSDSPKQIKKGVWEVVVVANWIVFDANNNQLLNVPFNKTLTVKAIPVAQSQTFQDEPEGFQKIINKVNNYGLQIINIENYDG